MKDLKIQIKIEDNDNLKEAHDLLLKLGFSTYSKESFDVWINQPKPIWLKTNCFDEQPNKIDWCFKESHGECKEITLPELRDLVVLKRNDREDANVSEENCLYDLYLTESRELYFYHCSKNKWILSNLNGDDDYYESLKPIEKPMKEYLNKLTDGTYKLVVLSDVIDGHDGLIEIPEGCNIITCENRKGNLVYFHWKSLDSDEFFLKDEKIWSNNFNETLSDFIEKNEGDVVIIWSRHTHPEELPFIDDECYTNKSDGVFILPKSEPCDISNWVEHRGESLNDQYAEIEKVRQSAWQKQEGGNHYKNLKIQPMQYALENKLDYAQANVVKYVTRHKEKNGKEDLLKAIHNLELMIEFYYGDEK